MQRDGDPLNDTLDELIGEEQPAVTIVPVPSSGELGAPPEETISEEEIEAIIAEILRGDDGYDIPEDLLHEPQAAPPQPLPVQAAAPEEDQEDHRLGLAARIKQMSVGQRIKLALKGGREARTVLMRDANRIIKRLVLQNPRLSEDEMIIIAKNRSEDTEFLETISKKKETTKNYQIRLALVTNPKTPMPISLRIVGTLFDRDLRQLAKSKNVPIVVNSAAKRLLFQRQTKS